MHIQYDSNFFDCYDSKLSYSYPFRLSLLHPSLPRSFLFLFTASPKLCCEISRSSKKHGSLNRKEKIKINIIKRASDGTRSSFETRTKGLKSPVFMRVFGLQHPLQNRVPRVRVLLPLPLKNGLNTGFELFFFFCSSPSHGLIHRILEFQFISFFVSAAFCLYCFRLLHHQKASIGGLFGVKN